MEKRLYTDRSNALISDPIRVLGIVKRPVAMIKARFYDDNDFLDKKPAVAW